MMWRGVVLGFFAYALFFARLGDRTPFQHLVRIINTDEAQELGHEVGAATKRISQRIGEQVSELGDEADSAGDGGIPAIMSDPLEGIANAGADRLDAAAEQEPR